VRYELARALRLRGRDGDRERADRLLAGARELASELGQTALLERLDPREDPTTEALSLRRDGDVWCITWADRTVRLRDSRGLELLARLVEHAGEELHVLQLVGRGDEPQDAGDAGAMLDERAIQSYRRRLLDLRDDLADAERMADVTRAEKMR